MRSKLTKQFVTALLALALGLVAAGGASAYSGVQGFVYVDANTNGIFDGGGSGPDGSGNDYGLAGKEVFIRSEDGIQQYGSSVTQCCGYYFIDTAALPDGTWVVSMGGNTIDGWTGPNPTSYTIVQDQTNGDRPTLNFGFTNAPPVAGFTLTRPAVNKPVTFTSTSTDDTAGLTCAWSGAFAATGCTVSHTFKKGTYTETLTVTDAGGLTAATSQTFVVPAKKAGAG